MDFNLLKQLEVPGDINPNDLKLLTSYATQIQNGKIPRVSLEEKNKLTSLISKYGPKEEIKAPAKDVNDMSPEERQAHREDIKRRLREKRNSMASSRQSKFVIEKNMNKTKTNNNTNTNTTNNNTNNNTNNDTNNRNVAPNINSLQNMDLSSLTNMINELQNHNANNRGNNIAEDDKLEDFLA